jgi:hypothetical protein
VIGYVKPSTQVLAGLSFKLMTAPLPTVIVLNTITLRILAVHLIETLLIAIPTALVAGGAFALLRHYWNPYIQKRRQRDRAEAENKT